MDDKRGADVRIPPPLVFTCFMLLGIVFDWVIPLDLEVWSILGIIGAVIAFAGGIVLLYLVLQFRRAKTHIAPWKPTSILITTGLYAYSRNPIYLAFCTIPIGLGLCFSQIGLLLSVLPSCVSVYYIAIRPEEAYLIEKFGEEYLNYQQRVRRWI